MSYKAWTKGVLFEDEARRQVELISNLPFIYRHVSVMPDVHLGIGATVGSVIPTVGAIIPAAVGVDIGCGMLAARLDIDASDLPDNLTAMRSAIEAAVPHGRTDNGGANDRGAWGTPPESVLRRYNDLRRGGEDMFRATPAIEHTRAAHQLGTLGTGNHFIEVCLDDENQVWIMLHSGSRGVGNRIGSHFISLAKKEMERWFIQLPDANLAYLVEGSEHFDGYVRAVSWAQKYAALNREIMLENVMRAVRKSIPHVSVSDSVISCHHNYISSEHHYGKTCWVTRKGAVSAQEGQMGIIPGSMGTRSYIVRGKGNRESFCSCSHGAGRKMSRTQARATISVEDHVRATEGVECRKDDTVVDESPAAYKSVEDVMAAQSDLVDIVHTLKQVLCVKG